MTLAMTCVVVYIYTVIAFNFFHKFYIHEDGTSAQDQCQSMWRVGTNYSSLTMPYLTAESSCTVLPVSFGSRLAIRRRNRYCMYASLALFVTCPVYWILLCSWCIGVGCRGSTGVLEAVLWYDFLLLCHHHPSGHHSRFVVYHSVFLWSMLLTTIHRSDYRCFWRVEGERGNSDRSTLQKHR